MFPILVFLFTVVPALEIYLLFKVGAQIGGFNTLFIVIATGIIGASLAKSQGLQILMKIQTEMQTGQLPGNHIIHGLMVFAGGLLLLTPGFMTDIFGFSLVMPGPRHILIIWVKSALDKAMKSGNFHFQTFSAGASRQGGGFYSYTSNESSFSHQKQANEEIAPGVFEAEYKKHD